MESFPMNVENFLKKILERHALSMQETNEAPSFHSTSKRKSKGNYSQYKPINVFTEGEESHIFQFSSQLTLCQ